VNGGSVGTLQLNNLKQITIINSNFIKNTAGFNGGALLLMNNYNLTILDSLFD